MSNLMARVSEAVSAHEPESRLVGAGRTTIALAQASVLAFTPAAYLFVPVGGDEVVLSCDGWPQRMSAYCLGGEERLQATSWVLLALLLVVASGLLPRVLSWVHLYATFSLHSSITLPDGGEAVAQVCTVFLVLVCAGDRRTWHWQSPRPRSGPSAMQGVAWAGLWGLRLQVAYVYLNSSIAKTAVAPWQDGTATYYVARMENFGAAGLLAEPILWATSHSLVAAATSWGAMAAEAAIAVLLLGAGRRQAAALVLSITLHVGIVVQLGIVSFATIMIGAVVCASSAGVATALRRRPPRPGGGAAVAGGGIAERRMPRPRAEPAADVVAG